ncbi:MAG: hypothetical protein NC834_04055 [Candidatus Omnitrophica bacterium]|nr:hypothetical protein [Candidatus Omnitrophota bacterium]
MKEVKFQGTGKSDGIENRGYYIKWEDAKGCYHYADCALTASFTYPKVEI